MLKITILLIWHIRREKKKENDSFCKKILYFLFLNTNSYVYIMINSHFLLHSSIISY